MAIAIRTRNDVLATAAYWIYKKFEPLMAERTGTLMDERLIRAEVYTGHPTGPYLTEAQLALLAARDYSAFERYILQHGLLPLHPPTPEQKFDAVMRAIQNLPLVYQSKIAVWPTFDGDGDPTATPDRQESSADEILRLGFPVCAEIRQNAPDLAIPRLRAREVARLMIAMQYNQQAGRPLFSRWLLSNCMPEHMEIALRVATGSDALDIPRVPIIESEESFARLADFLPWLQGQIMFGASDGIKDMAIAKFLARLYAGIRQVNEAGVDDVTVGMGTWSWPRGWGLHRELPPKIRGHIQGEGLHALMVCPDAACNFMEGLSRGTDTLHSVTPEFAQYAEEESAEYVPIYRRMLELTGSVQPMVARTIARFSHRPAGRGRAASARDLRAIPYNALDNIFGAPISTLLGFGTTYQDKVSLARGMYQEDHIFHFRVNIIPQELPMFDPHEMRMRAGGQFTEEVIARLELTEEVYQRVCPDAPDIDREKAETLAALREYRREVGLSEEEIDTSIMASFAVAGYVG